MDGPTDGQSNRWTDRQSGLERHVYVIKTSLDTRHLSWKEAVKQKLLTIQKSAGRTGGPTDLATHQGRVSSTKKMYLTMRPVKETLRASKRGQTNSCHVTNFHDYMHRYICCRTVP